MGELPSVSPLACRKAGSPTLLLPEEGSLELRGLRGREPRLREYLDGLISDLPLLRRKRRGVAVPAQTGAYVRVDPCLFSRNLIRDSMQVLHLLEERLKFIVGNRHDRPRVLPRPGKSFPQPPLVPPSGQKIASAAIDRPYAIAP